MKTPKTHTRIQSNYYLDIHVCLPPRSLSNLDLRLVDARNLALFRTHTHIYFFLWFLFKGEKSIHGNFGRWLKSIWGAPHLMNSPNSNVFRFTVKRRTLTTYFSTDLKRLSVTARHQETRHKVTISRADTKRLGGGKCLRDAMMGFFDFFFGNVIRDGSGQCGGFWWDGEMCIVWQPVNRGRC